MPEHILDTTYIVYKHTNQINGKSYIGISSQSLKSRSGSNGKNYNKNKHFYDAIKKYGWNNFSHEVLFSGLSPIDAQRKEIELIAKYQSNNPQYGYNLSSGGESGNAGCTMSEAEKSRRSQAYSGKGNPMYGKRGKNNPNYQRKCSDATREALSRALKGRTFDDSSIEKMRAAQKQRAHWAGEKNPMYGKTYADAPQAKRVICLDTQKSFSSIKEAAETYGICASSITACCKGKRNVAGGYHWKYDGGDNNGA